MIVELPLCPQVLTHFNAFVCRCSDCPILRCLQAQDLPGPGPPTLRSSHTRILPHPGPPTPGSSHAMVESHCHLDRTDRIPGALSVRSSHILAFPHPDPHVPKGFHAQVHPHSNAPPPRSLKTRDLIHPGICPNQAFICPGALAPRVCPGWSFCVCLLETVTEERVSRTSLSEVGHFL